MRFVLGSIFDFARVGISITTERQFSGQAIKHTELLSTEELDKVQAESGFSFVEEVPADWNEE